MTWDLAAARARIGLPADDTAQDVNLQAALDTALAVAESYCDRRFLKQEDTQEFTSPIGPTLLVRRWPLDSLATIEPLPPLPDPPPDPVAVPSTWKMDKKRGIVWIVGQPPWAGGVIPAVGSSPPAVWPASTGRVGFVLTYTGGFEKLPADLEAALWMVFDQVWATTPGYGLPAGTQANAGGAVKSFGIDGMRIDYDTATTSGSVGAGGASAWGIVPANAVGILDFYRAETAALGG